MIERTIHRLKLIFIPCGENKYRPEFLASKFLYYYAVLLLILKIGIAPFLACFPESFLFADLTKTALIELTNKTRISFGLQPLSINPLLEEAAYLKVEDMFEKDYFSHQSPEGISPWYWFQIAGYNYQFAGENLAIGFLDSEEVYRAWLDSSSHKSNLLNSDYSEIGMAVVKSEFQGKETSIVVQHFGSPQPQAKIVEKMVKTPEISEKAEIPVGKSKVEILPEAATPFQTKEVLSAFQAAGDKNNLTFKLFSFLDSSYYDLLRKVIYVSLIFIIFSLFVTVFFDVFIYRAFEIQYKDIVLKAVCFSVLLVVLLLIDKNLVVQLIPHNFMIS